MWDHQKFRSHVEAEANRKHTTKEAIFDSLSNAIHLSSRRIKEFQTPRSKPGPEIIASISEYFGTNFETASDAASNSSLSDTLLIKWCLYDTLLSFNRFFSDTWSEEAYKELTLKLANTPMILPKQIQDQLVAFKENNIDPLFTEQAFVSCSEEGVVGHTNGDTFVVENSQLFFERYVSVIDSAELAFAALKESLAPLLAS